MRGLEKMNQFKCVIMVYVILIFQCDIPSITAERICFNRASNQSKGSMVYSRTHVSCEWTFTGRKIQECALFLYVSKTSRPWYRCSDSYMSILDRKICLSERRCYIYSRNSSICNFNKIYEEKSNNYGKCMNDEWRIVDELPTKITLYSLYDFTLQYNFISGYEDSQTTNESTRPRNSTITAQTSCSFSNAIPIVLGILLLCALGIIGWMFKRHRKLTAPLRIPVVQYSLRNSQRYEPGLTLPPQSGSSAQTQAQVSSAYCDVATARNLHSGGIANDAVNPVNVNQQACVSYGYSVVNKSK
uniref:uncharacterized protein LOC120331752 n=1 Tax=Styela clava TaxID=7725 RepID=UPI00193A6A08|nr:uncharacterized protein LOC120331752 [Styela clava]